MVTDFLSKKRERKNKYLSSVELLIDQVILGDCECEVATKKKQKNFSFFFRCLPLQFRFFSDLRRSSTRLYELPVDKLVKRDKGAE